MMMSTWQLVIFDRNIPLQGLFHLVSAVYLSWRICICIIIVLQVVKDIEKITVSYIWSHVRAFRPLPSSYQFYDHAGTIPTSIGSASALVYVYLNNNLLTGDSAQLLQVLVHYSNMYDLNIPIIVVVQGLFLLLSAAYQHWRIFICIIISWQVY